MARGDTLLEALARGRTDRQFFSQFFLSRTLHDGQCDFVDNAEATVNALATANRWGKTTVLQNLHFHAGIYKTGAEERYLDELGALDLERFTKVRYQTIHTSGDWETCKLVWDESHKLIDENGRLRAFIKDRPRTIPPHIDFINGARWKFRTLGNDASGIDGNSFYLVSIDEAGWIADLEAKMANVIRVRVADVRGRIVIVGTFKPGVSKDFYKICVRASAHTGVGLSFDHRAGDDDGGGAAGSLDASIRSYLREYGIDLDEFEAAVAGG